MIGARDVGRRRRKQRRPTANGIVALMPVETAEARKAQNHVLFLMNFTDELQRKVSVGKWRHTPLMTELPRKQVI